MLPRYLFISLGVEVICRNAMACRVFHLLRQFGTEEEHGARCSVVMPTLRFRQATGGFQEDSNLGDRQEGLVA